MGFLGGNTLAGILRKIRGADIDSESATTGQALTADGSGGTSWEDVASGGYTDITYADLVTAIGASALTAGSWYRLTDYQLRHYIVDGDGTQYTGEGNEITGTVEPLLMRALAVDALDPNVLSPSHPEDRIYYDWNPANWLLDPWLATNGNTIISGYTGTIVYRNDTLNGNSVQGDWRSCRFRRWEVTADAWSGASVPYAAASLVLHSSVIWKAMVETSEEPGTGNAWLLLLDLSTAVYWNASPSAWNGVISGVAYSDLPMFADATCIQNKFDVYFDVANGAYLYLNNTFGADCSRNTFGAGCYNNTFGADCYNNTFGADCSRNTFVAYCSNNTFGAECSSNTFGADCSSNTFGVSCGNNTFGAYCVYNTFVAYCSNNTFIDSAQYNDLAPGISSSDFSTATHVYAAYNCWLYTDATLGARLRYISNDVVVYATPTA